MSASTVILRQDFETALEAGRSAAAGLDLPGLSAPLNTTLLGAVSRVWDRIEVALEAAFTYGRDRAQELVDHAVAGVESLLQEAGDRVGDAQQALLLRMEAYVRTLVGRALSHVRPTMVVGSDSFVLDGIDMAQTLSLTGSLKSNVLEMIAVTAGGELSVNARYVRAP